MTYFRLSLVLESNALSIYERLLEDGVSLNTEEENSDEAVSENPQEDD